MEEFLHKNMKARARVLSELMDNKELPESLVVKKLNIAGESCCKKTKCCPKCNKSVGGAAYSVGGVGAYIQKSD